MAVHEVQTGTMKARLAAPKGDHIEVQLRRGRFYESDLLAHLQGLEIGGIYVDVGAHVGNHAVAFARMGAETVVAYEPQPRLFALLGLNRLLNGLRPVICPRRCVVHDSWTGAAVVERQEANTGATRFGREGELVYPTARLDDELARIDGIGLIKVDVEGLELAVLRSARRVLARNRPVLVCEAHDDDRFAELDAYVRPLGYRTDGRAWGATPTYVWRPER